MSVFRTMWKFFLACLFYCTCAVAAPELGHWEVDTPLDSYLVLPKSVFEDTTVNVKVLCSTSQQINLMLSIFWSECADAFGDVKQNVDDSSLTMSLGSGLTTQNIGKEEKIGKCSPTEPMAISAKIARSGSQMSVVSVRCKEPSECPLNFDVQVVADINSTYGYLSAIEFPLRTFSGILSLAYALLGFLWLIFTFYHWKDLLRIQYYITLMIIIGLIEHLTLFGLYESLNRTGVIIKSALIFALVISCLKRTLARFLLLVVCIGYGITKSRLGTTYRRIVWMCVAYLVCCLLDGGLRAFQPRFKPSLTILLGGLPMIAVDMAILWWSFSYLVSTLRETRMRRNKVKYRLYRIFSALLIAVAVVSVICMSASIFLLHWRPCTKAWRYIWFDETFWQLLFYVVLLTIVILWRPSSTNRLYARSAFLDPDVEPPPEDLEERLIDAIVSGISDEAEDRAKNDKVASEDEALRWAEENIPSSQETAKESNEQSNPNKGTATTSTAAVQLKLD